MTVKELKEILNECDEDLDINFEDRWCCLYEVGDWYLWQDSIDFILDFKRE